MGLFAIPIFIIYQKTMTKNALLYSLKIWFTTVTVAPAFYLVICFYNLHNNNINKNRDLLPDFLSWPFCCFLELIIIFFYMDIIYSRHCCLYQLIPHKLDKNIDHISLVVHSIIVRVHRNYF